jgi:hypothetical protein
MRKDEVQAFLKQLDFTPNAYFFDTAEAGPRELAVALKQQGVLVYFEPENDKEQNKFIDAIKGRNQMESDAIDEVKNSSLEIYKALRGKMSEAELRDVAAGDAEARKKFRKLMVGAGRGESSDSDIAIIEGLANQKIGGRNVLEVMGRGGFLGFGGGEAGFRNIMNDEGSQEDWKSLAAGANRRGSTSYDAMNKIAELIRLFAEFSTGQKKMHVVMES